MHQKAVLALFALILFSFMVPFLPPPPCPPNAQCVAPPQLRSVAYATFGVGGVVDRFGRYAILGLPEPVIIGATTSQTYGGGTSTSYELLCVEAGEPLYPSTRLVPLATFAQAWGSQYSVGIFYSNSTVVVSSQTHVGSSNLKSVSFIVERC